MWASIKRVAAGMGSRCCGNNISQERVQSSKSVHDTVKRLWFRNHPFPFVIRAHENVALTHAQKGLPRWTKNIPQMRKPPGLGYRTTWRTEHP